ncbi:MAG: signal peptide peptidase SppA [Planctomycetota bacterium]
MSTDDPSQVHPSPPAAAPQTIVVQQRESWFGRFGKVLLVLLGLAVMTIFGLTASYQSYFNEPGGPQEKYHSLNKTALKKIAVIKVSGTIMEGEDFVKKQIDRVRKDDSVVGVVLRVNSPGGTVTYSDYLLHHLNELVEAKSDGEDRFPLVVSMGSICASGGYYVSMAVGDEPDTIFAEPTTWTGSIGVIIPRYDLTDMIDKLGVEEDSIASGKFKQMGSPTREMTDAERELFQELVDETFGRFKEVVYSGRPDFRDNPEALDEVATGQIFTAGQAVEKGLVDKIGFIEEAIERVAELAGMETDELRCVRYEETQAPLDALLGASATARMTAPRNDLRALLDLSTPRAYYLCTLLPSLLESR